MPNPLTMAEIFDSFRTMGQTEFKIAAVRMLNNTGNNGAMHLIGRMKPDDWLTPDEIKSRQEAIAAGDGL